MNPQYEILAKCLLPAHMLEWFELTNVEVKPKETLCESLNSFQKQIITFVSGINTHIRFSKTSKFVS